MGPGQISFWLNPVASAPTTTRELTALATDGVVSNLVVPIGTLFGERFLYLPSVGFCMLVAMTRWPRVAAAILVVVWGVRTGLRNRVWHDDLTLAESMVASAPDSAHA